MELESCGAERFRDVFVGCEFLEVRGVKHGEHVEGNVERRFGIVHEIADNGVVFAEIAVVRDEAKDFVGEAGHGGESFDFLLGEARRLQDGALDDFVCVTDECAARFGASLDGKLDALSYGHLGKALQQRLTPHGVGLRFGGGFGEGGFVDGRTPELVKLIFLVGGEGGRVLKGGGEDGGIADTVELVHESLNSESRKMADDRDEKFRRAICVLHHGVADTGFVSQISCSVGEKSRHGLFTF